MIRAKPTPKSVTPVALALCGVAFAVPAAAQSSGTAATRPAVSHTPPPSPNVAVNIVNLLVKQGVFTQEQGAALIKQAEDEAFVARQAVRDAAAKADIAELWGFAFIQGYKSVSQPDLEIPMTVKPQLLGAVQRSCGNNKATLFMDLTALVAEKVKLNS